MKIRIESIPHHEQRYPTVGDYWQEGDTDQVRVSAMKDWRYEILVAVHELIEMALTRHRGISEESITAFDVEYERLREEELVKGEPGDSAKAPYQKEHFFATNVERLFAAELGVNWADYDQYVDQLGVKR